MNDIERVIEIIVGMSNDYLDESEQDISLSKAVSALEKQIPKKPRKGNIPYCPHCEKVFVTCNDDYCHRCGGKIDWSDSNE